MFHLEGGNESIGYKIGSFLRSKFANLHLPPLRSKKTSLSLLAIATLVAAPAAAFSIHNTSPPNTSISSTDSSSESTNNNVATTQDNTQSTPTTGSSLNVQAGTGSNTQVTVNGQSVPVPDNGSVHKTYTTNNGHTTVDVTNSSTNSYSSSSTVNINSFSYSSNTVNGSSTTGGSGH